MEKNDAPDTHDAGTGGQFTPADIDAGREAIAAEAESHRAARSLLLEIGRAQAQGRKNLRLAPSQSAHLLRRLGLAASKPVTRGPQDGTRRYALTLDGEALFRRITTGDPPDE